MINIVITEWLLQALNLLTQQEYPARKERASLLRPGPKW